MLVPGSYYHIYNHGNGRDNLFIEARNFSFFLEKYEKHVSPVVETLAYSLMRNHFHVVIRVKDADEIARLLSKPETFVKLRKDEQYPTNGSSGGIELLDKGGTLEKFANDKYSPFNELSEGSELPGNDETLERFSIDKYSPSSRVSLTNGLFVDEKKLEKFISKQFSNLFSSYTQSFNKVYKRRGSLFIKNFKRKLIHSDQQLLNTILYVHANPVHHGFEKDLVSWKWTSYKPIIDGNSTVCESAKVLRLFGGVGNFIGMHEKVRRSKLGLKEEDTEWDED